MSQPLHSPTGKAQAPLPPRDPGKLIDQWSEELDAAADELLEALKAASLPRPKVASTARRVLGSLRCVKVRLRRRSACVVDKAAERSRIGYR
jgi:hypothetical protein